MKSFNFSFAYLFSEQKLNKSKIVNDIIDTPKT